MATLPSLHQRTSGILLHLTSLPGPHGSGDLGPDAYRFADWLVQAGQSWWQMLPSVPPSGGKSPYQSISAFAGNPLWISLGKLREQGLLSDEDVAPTEGLISARFNEAAVVPYRESRLRKAYEAFCQRNHELEGFAQFCEKERTWLADYALFCAIKSTKNQASWTDWEEPLRERHPDALRKAEEPLRHEIGYHQFLQYEFARQWSELKHYCESKGLGLMGDIPIFVAHDSADVWAHPDEYLLDEAGNPTVVAGVPPDYFSATGQRWGNALYRWDAHRQHGYRWWVDRFHAIFEKFDALRIDHFIGFHRYWAIKAQCLTAMEGEYQPGPGADFFAAVERELGKLPIVAEDLGVVTPEVKALREQFDFPGMRVLQFAFGTDKEARNYQPHAFPPNCVAYTGTHDNDTTVGWFAEITKRAHQGDTQAQKERDFILRYTNTDGHEVAWDLIRLAMLSASNTALFPLQDILSLDSRARMNLPGTHSEENWSWRVSSEALSQDVQQRLWALTDTYARTR